MSELPSVRPVSTLPMAFSSPDLTEGLTQVDRQQIEGHASLLWLATRSSPGSGRRPSHNTKLAVARILGDGKRQRTRVFSELQSHYVFADRFGRPGKGNDQGQS
jgi:hypothetical protein